MCFEEYGAFKWIYIIILEEIINLLDSQTIFMVLCFKVLTSRPFTDNDKRNT